MASVAFITLVFESSRKGALSAEEILAAMPEPMVCYLRGRDDEPPGPVPFIVVALWLQS